jgi:hypothetical protein
MQASWIRVKRVGIIDLKELHYRVNVLSPGLDSSMLSYLLSSNPRYVRLACQTVSDNGAGTSQFSSAISLLFINYH